MAKCEAISEFSKDEASVEVDNRPDEYRSGVAVFPDSGRTALKGGVDFTVAAETGQKKKANYLRTRSYSRRLTVGD